MEKQNPKHYNPSGRRMLEKRQSEMEGELSEENRCSGSSAQLKSRRERWLQSWK